MLNVYIGNIKSDNIVRFNDAWFNYNLSNITVDDNIKKFMKLIDDSVYIKEDKMYSRFDKELCISMKLLSTGCKTLINVYSFKNKIFDIVECGDNVIEEIFKLKNGNIFISCYILIPYFDCKVNVITNRGNNLMTRKELIAYLDEVFPNGY